MTSRGSPTTGAGPRRLRLRQRARQRPERSEPPRLRRGGDGRHRPVPRLSLVLAAIVLVAFVTILRPVVPGAVVGWASDNPGALGIDFVADMVQRGPRRQAHDGAASTDTGQVRSRSGPARPRDDRRAPRGAGVPRRSPGVRPDRRREGLTDQLKTGDFILRKSMTPEELVTALLNPPANPFIDIDLRTGLRLEQITAKLQTIEGLTMDPRDFYELTKHPTPELLADYPWIEIPRGGVAGGLPLAGHVPRPAGHDRRGAGPAHARQVPRGDRRPDDRPGGARPVVLRS